MSFSKHVSRYEHIPDSAHPLSLFFCNTVQVIAQTQERGIFLIPWVGAFWSNSSGGDLPIVHESGVVEAKMASSPALGGLLISRRIRFEISDHISRQNASFQVPQMGRLAEPVQTQYDVIITVGYTFGPL